jgi:carbonic anhydrase
MKVKAMKRIVFGVGLTLVLTSGIAVAEDAHAPAAVSGPERVKEAIAHIYESNSSFWTSRGPEYYEPFTGKQVPLATVVTCSDSRVHMHAVDDTPDNDVFVIRNIGNQIATAEGSVEYGIVHLHTPLLLVIGHSACGAVTAAMGDYSHESEAIKRELGTLKVKKDSSVPKEVIANVNDQVDVALAKFKPQVDTGALAILGTVYDFRNDYNHGQGRLIIVNLNGETDSQVIRRSPLLADIEDLAVGIASP